MNKRVIQFHYHGGKSGGSREFPATTQGEKDEREFIQLNRGKWASHGHFTRTEDGKVAPVKLARPGLSASQMGSPSPPDKSKKVIEDGPEGEEGLNCPHCEGVSKPAGSYFGLPRFQCTSCGGEFHSMPPKTVPKTLDEARDTLRRPPNIIPALMIPKEEKPVKNQGVGGKIADKITGAKDEE